AAGITSDEAIKLARSLEAVTTFSDEAILSSQTILLQFTKLGKDVFPQVEKTALDVATRLGKDLTTVSLQLGKALNDPVEGMTNLVRLGVRFTQQQQDQVDAMVKAGKTAEAQTFILDALQKGYGGAAEAAGSTFAGSLAKLKNQINNIEEAIGKTIATALSPYISKLVEVAAVVAQVANGTKSLTDLQKTLTVQFGTIGTVLGNIISFFAEHRNALIALAGAIGGFLAISIIAATVAMAGFIGVSLPVILIFAAIGGAVALLIANWSTIVNFFTGIKTAAQDFITNVRSAIDQFIATLQGVLPVILAVLFPIPALMIFIAQTIIANWDAITAAIGTAITNVIAFLQQLPIAVGTFFVNLFTIDMPFAVGFLIGYLFTAIPDLINNLIIWFTQLPENVSLLLQQTWFWVQTIFTQIQTFLFEIVPATITGIIAFLWQLPPIVLAIFTQVYNFIFQQITLIVTFLLNQLSILPVKIQGWIASIPSIVGSIFENAKNSVITQMMQMFQGVNDWWEKIKGVLEGIKGAAEAAIDAVRRGLEAGKNVAQGKKFQEGGFVLSTGPATLHAGEFVLSKDMLEGSRDVPAEVKNTFNQPINIQATLGTEMDFDLLGYRLAWVLRNAR
ncbi:MAG: hypothetical protein Q7K45_03855, partial [Nanoarchaeota archaeon]|nr:hypothetical protein [Nanoarchaeota archaeon]